MRRVIVTGLVFLCLTAAATAQSQTKPGAWLNGTWEGTGYQMDNNETWTMLVKAARGRYTIEYPSLKCGGTWQLVSINSWRARFRERLKFGVEECANNGSVIIDRLSRRQIAFRYINQGDRDVSSSAILNRRKPAGTRGN